MKKILAIMIISMFSLNCLARSIEIYNNTTANNSTGAAATVQDFYGDNVSVSAGKSVPLNVSQNASELLITNNANGMVYRLSIDSTVTSITISPNFTIKKN